MRGKHIAITGPTAGIGLAASHELARRGAQLTLLCRSPDKAAALQQAIVAAGGLKPDIIIMDMARLDSVREAAAALAGAGRPLDVLLNNAGVVNATRNVTVDGFEETLAVNHFAPFLITGLLMPALLAAPAARIVNVASDAHHFVKGMGFEDMQAERSYKTFREYGRSKLANILFTRRLAQQLRGSSITVNCLHPGAVSTSLGSQNEGFIAKLVPLLVKPFFRTAERGAETSIYLCSSDEVADISGEYFVDSKVRKPKPWACDDAAAERLWQYTEEALDYTFPVNIG
jgi:NAD(P)-dependent dehydrogenase (short-subunit alcohol dehydrogenase family)